MATEYYLNALRRTEKPAEIQEALYLLAKTKNLCGEKEKSIAFLELLLEEGEGKYRNEALFRVADFRFNQTDYQSASRLFKELIESEDVKNRFYARAHYMYGWSLYKMGDVGGALLSFAEFLREDPFSGIKAAGFDPENLRSDVFRSYSLALHRVCGQGDPKKMLDALEKQGVPEPRFAQKYQDVVHRHQEGFTPEAAECAAPFFE